METLSDEQVRDVLLAVRPSGGRPHGEDTPMDCTELSVGTIGTSRERGERFTTLTT
jgi:hypothetical protein